MNHETEPAPPLPEWLTREYPFERRMVVANGDRIHLVDQGAGRPVLMVHGNPTWSYLWRKVMPPVLAAGHRVVAPDLLGLGLSDKPRRIADHTLERHAAVMCSLVEALDLRELTIVGQDWGGPMATIVAARMPERVRAVVYGNTAVLAPKKRLKATAFHRFSHMPVVSDVAFRGFNFPVPILHKTQGDPASIGPEERRAYAYPLARWRDRAAPLAMARMVPNGPDHPSIPILSECEAWVRRFEGPAELVWGLKDPILGRSLKRMREALPHARVTETEAGHFLQEEVPELLAEAILRVSD